MLSLSKVTMNAPEFVEITRRFACDVAVRDTVSALERPPGRRPSLDLIRESNWFGALDEDGRAVVKDIIRRSAENAIFDLFCILDGVRAIEDTPEKGDFELRFIKNEKVDVISPSDDFLHELFK